MKRGIVSIIILIVAMAIFAILATYALTTSIDIKDLNGQNTNPAAIQKHVHELQNNINQQQNNELNQNLPQ